VVTDTKLVKSGGEVDRVPGKEISMDTIQCPINLHTLTDESGVHITFLAKSHAPGR